MLPRQLLQIDYDQFQRYAAVTVLLKPLLGAWQQELKPLRILEVGSHTLNLLPTFLSPLSIEIVRADLQTQYAGDIGPYVTIEKDQPLPFADGSFDVVVAMEVLEHIPSQARQSAMSEWARVARKGIFFTCPNGDAVIDQERRADADFQARHGRVHPWLEEHERYGRPTAEEVQAVLNKLDLSCHRFNNSPLSEWLPLLLVSERIFEQGDQELFGRLNEMLNSRPFHACIQGPAYRSIYAGFKSSAIDQKAQAIWQGNQAIRKAESADNTDVLDPTRLLAARLSQFIIRNRRNEVDAARLETLASENAGLKQKLVCAEQTLGWLRWEMATAQQKKRCNLENPLHQAKLVDLEAVGVDHWRVTGVQPAFEWPCAHQRGWHRIELFGQVEPGHQPILSLDYGYGFNDEHIVRFGTWLAGPDRQSVNTFFHHPVTRLRLKPSQKQTLSAVIVEHIAIKSLSAAQVAVEGIGRLFCDLVRFPRQTWQAMKDSGSCLRLGMQLTTVPRGLPIAANNEYQHWLLENRCTRSQRKRLIAGHRDSSIKIVVFVRLEQGESTVDLERTLQSLYRQDECRWELWCAAEPELQQNVKPLETIRQLGRRLHWLNDSPDRGLAGLLNECLKQSNADWLIQLQAGDVLESDACLQYLEATRNHPHAALLIAEEGFFLPNEGETEPCFKPKIKPELLQRQPMLLGEAYALHAPTLMNLGGFHAGYEGALSIEYVLRMLRAKYPLAQLNRVVLHHPPRPPISRAVLNVVARIQEETASSEYHVHYARVTEPAEVRQREMSIDALIPVTSRRDRAS